MVVYLFLEMAQHEKKDRRMLVSATATITTIKSLNTRQLAGSDYQCTITQIHGHQLHFVDNSTL